MLIDTPTLIPIYYKLEKVSSFLKLIPLSDITLADEKNDSLRKIFKNADEISSY